MLLSDDTFQEEGIAPAAQRAEGVLSRVRQVRGQDKGDATWEVSKRNRRCLYCQCQKGALPRARGVQGKICSTAGTSEEFKCKKQVQREELTQSK